MVRCFSAAEFCSRGPLSLKGTLGELVVIMDSAPSGELRSPFSSLVLTDPSFSARFRLDRPALLLPRVEGTGERFNEIPFAFSPRLRTIFSQMLTRCKEPRSATTCGDILFISDWRSPIADLPCAYPAVANTSESKVMRM